MKLDVRDRVARWYLRREVRLRCERAYRALEGLDLAMQKAGLPRCERRRVWRDVIAGRTEASALVKRL